MWATPKLLSTGLVSNLQRLKTKDMVWVETVDPLAVSSDVDGSLVH